MVDWLNEDGIFILDRRFRDTVKTITEFGCQCEMPAFLKKKKTLESIPKNKPKAQGLSQYFVG